MLFWAGVLVAVGAALRSTWSPCGLSMLSSITPFGERARGHRYGVTAGWFWIGSAAGGLCLGAAMAALAVVVRVAVAGVGFGGAGVGGSAGALIIGAGLAAAGSLVDAGRFGPILPLVRRQVDDAWLARYRPWVYGAGFGWQVGVGFATYVMTAGVAVVVGLGALTGSPAEALAIGVIFGAVRGSTVRLTSRAADPAGLRSLHRWLDLIGPAVRGGVAGVMGGAAVGAAVAAAFGPARYGWLGAAVSIVTGVVGATVGASVVGARSASDAPSPEVPTSAGV